MLFTRKTHNMEEYPPANPVFLALVMAISCFRTVDMFSRCNQSYCCKNDYLAYDLSTLRAITISGILIP